MRATLTLEPDVARLLKEEAHRQRMSFKQRITVNLDEDVLRAVRSLAHERRESLGDVISALVREAMRPPDTTTYEAGFPVFRMREGAAPITPEMVESALEEG